jgi:protein phosphatase
VARLVELGQLTPEAAKTHPRKNEVYRILGSSPETPPDLFSAELGAGDTILLCSDGLHSLLSDSDIRDLVVSSPTISAAVDGLVGLANSRGGDDNITVVVIRITGR